MGEMFDTKLRALRRERAARQGPELFLLERAFADGLERLELIRREFADALLVGCPDPGWRERLAALAGSVVATEDLETLAPQSFDLVLAVGTLDTANELQLALRGYFEALRPGGLFLGALAGGETLPLLRRVMAAADRVSGGASPRIHPRIEAAMLAPLLEQAGFVRPVVDVDRVEVAYSSLDRLVADLRGMAATNILTARSRRPISRSALAAALAEFDAAKRDGRAVESFEILHFAAWKPGAG